jgi:transposase
VESRPPGSQGFTLVRKGWAVERTNALNGRSRRNSKDSERKPESAAAMIQISNIDLMLRKLAPFAQREFRYHTAA